MKTAIVSAANAPFFPMLIDLLDSIDALKPDSDLDLCLLDVGFTSAQRSQLETRAKKIVEPGWDFNFPTRDKMPRHMQAQLARPFLPKHFPGYDRFIYLDADLWLQDWRVISMLLLSSQADVLSIVPEIHHAYWHNYNRQPHQLAYVRDHYIRAFGEHIGRPMTNLPIINTGLWSMRTNLPFWGAWATVLHQALQRDASHLTEQCALNVAVYIGKIAYYSLPPWCNWICSQAPPIFDPDTRLLYEPQLPHDQISVIHLVDYKMKPQSVQSTDGITREMPLTYSSIRKGIITPPSAS